MRKWLITLLVICAAIAIYMTSKINGDEEPENESVMENEEQVEQIQEAPQKEKIHTMSLAMVGDILLHEVLLDYKDYTVAFAPVKEQMQSYDYLIANQESLPIGNKFALAGYPQFASPDYLLRDLKLSGVDLVNLANNHVVDKGEAGVTALFENLKKYEMPYIGVYESTEDEQQPRILTHDNISVGLLSYTFSTNGLFLPADSPYIINYIDEEKIVAEIKGMKGTVDVVTVLMHWGPEFTTEHNTEQVRLAKLINEAGADIIFGVHPHVLQGYEKLVSTTNQETHVFYSLGNYFSKTITSNTSLVGGIASLQITKKDGQVEVAQPELFATAMLLDSDSVYRLYPLQGNEDRAVHDLAWVKSILGPAVKVQ